MPDQVRHDGGGCFAYEAFDQFIGKAKPLMRILGGLAAATLLAACSNALVPPAAGPRPIVREPSQPPVRRPTAATPLAPTAAPAAAATVTTAAGAGLLAGPDIASLPITDAAAARALAAFKTSCSAMIRRTDTSGLTRGTDWQPSCDAARSTSDGDARAFFARWFEAVQVADGKAFATGYYEPEIAGSRMRRPGYETPIYRRPPDLVDVDLGAFSTELKGKRIRGRVQGGSFVPYPERSEIVDKGVLDGRGLELAYAADPVEFFFLQIQGSGRLRLPDGSVMRIGYDNQNGREYVGIGSLLRQRNILPPGGASMQGIIAWMRQNPEQGHALMNENKSFIFFRELTGAGPIGSMGVAVSAQASVATDPKFVPLGAPVFLSMDRTDATGLWVAQDTGGAIRGSNRFDTFWGAGDDARAIAGGMSAKGTAFLLLPVGTLARLGGSGGGTTPQR
jgi:membrane-bound lytic murein transglycosylase A